MFAIQLQGDSFKAFLQGSCVLVFNIINEGQIHFVVQQWERFARQAFNEYCPPWRCFCGVTTWRTLSIKHRPGPRQSIHVSLHLHPMHISQTSSHPNQEATFPSAARAVFGGNRRVLKGFLWRETCGAIAWFDDFSHYSRAGGEGRASNRSEWKRRPDNAPRFRL